MRPDVRIDGEDDLRLALDAVRRRLLVRDACAAFAMSAAAAVVVGLAVVSTGAGRTWSAAGALAGASVVLAVVAGRTRGRTSRRATARAIDEGSGHHNLIVTAEELLDDGGQVSGWMRARVMAGAGVAAQGVSPSALVPLRRPVAAATLSGVALAAAAMWAPSPSPAGEPTALAGRKADDGPAGATIRVEVEAPGYTGRAPTTVIDPERLEVLAGSRVRVHVPAVGIRAVRYGEAAITLTSAGEEAVGEVTPAETGYLAFELASGRRLVPVVVTPDRAPVVTVSAPGKDLLVPQPEGRIGVTASATDDYGLRSLELSYTKVSGSGEQFDFTQGSLPLAIARGSAREWRGGGTFVLDRLQLEPGDSVVYRVMARDARPGDAGLAVSDTFFIEVAGPGMVALPGFELPPEGERYALSQQMIVLKLQRLRAREASLGREALVEELQGLAAEQRAVRANFIFLLGGHVEDEEEEAEQSSEISEGRMQNTARAEINAAIRFMSQAEQAMIAVDSGQALPPAKSAADALQRAFGRNRYFLRTVPVRSRIDPSRRLTGDLAEAADWRRAVEPGEDDTVAAAAQALLRDLLAVMGPPGEGGAPEVGLLAERALAVDPASSEWQAVSSALLALRDVLAGNGPETDRQRRAGDAVSALAAQVRAHAPAAAAGSSGDAALRGAWAAEGRR